MDIEKKLHDEIGREIDILKEVDEGSESYTNVVDGVTKLMDRALAIDKFNSEVEEKQKQMKEDRIDRITKNCLSAVGIILPICITVWGTKASFEFEKEGTVTTIMGRGFINKLIPKNGK